MPACEEYSRQAGLSPRDSQKLAFADLYHDFGHAGSTYRQLVPSFKGSPLSNEEFAAIKADEAASPWYTPEERREIREMILASSYGQNQIGILPSEHATMLYRPYKPSTLLEKLLVLADVSSFRWGTESYLQDSLNLLRERSTESIPQDFSTFIEQPTKFLTVIHERLADAAPFFSKQFTGSVSDQIERIRADLLGVATPKTQLHATWKGKFEDVRAAVQRQPGLL